MPVEPNHLSLRLRPEPGRPGPSQAGPAQESFEAVYRGVTSEARIRDDQDMNRARKRSEDASQHTDDRAARVDRDTARTERQEELKSRDAAARDAAADAGQAKADRADTERLRADRARSDGARAEAPAPEAETVKPSAGTATPDQASAKATDAPLTTDGAPAQTATGEAGLPPEAASVPTQAVSAAGLDPNLGVTIAAEGAPTAAADAAASDNAQTPAAPSGPEALASTAATTAGLTSQPVVLVATAQAAGAAQPASTTDATGAAGDGASQATAVAAVGGQAGPSSAVDAGNVQTVPPAKTAEAANMAGGEVKASVQSGLEAAARIPDVAAPKLDIVTTPLTPAADVSAKLLTAETAASAAQTATGAARSGEVAATMQALPVEIGMRALKGNTEFTIRLDPAELGKIEVKLAIDEEGGVTAKLVADRVETLQLLQRDAKTLERAFDQAGLKTSPDTLQFSLRGDNAGGRGQHAHQDHQPQTRGRSDDDAVALPAEAVLARYGLRSPTGVDIRI